MILRERLRQAEATRQLGGREAARQLEQGQRVPPGFGQDPLPDLLIERPRHDRAQQGPGVGLPESLDSEPGDSLEVLARLAGGERQQHALGLEPTSGEGERLRRGPVQPLAVVHHADELLGHAHATSCVSLFAATGKRKKNRAPSSLFSAFNFPPCASTIERTMVKPIPIPFGLVE